MAPIFDCPISNGTFVMTSILLADHHSLFRSGMAKLIDGIGISESRLAIDDEVTFITFGCLEIVNT